MSVHESGEMYLEAILVLSQKTPFVRSVDVGRALAETIYERHTVLSKMLIHLGVSEETAAADACRMEHVISDESFQAIKRHANSLR